MIENKQGIFQHWYDVSEPTSKEIKANKAPLKFFATDSLSEKVGSVFNTTMFIIAGLKLLTFIPMINTKGSKFVNKIFNVMPHSSLLQIPIIESVFFKFSTKILVSIALFTAIKKILAVGIHFIICQAIIDSQNKKTIHTNRKNLFKDMGRRGYQCRRITLIKSDAEYDAFTLEHSTTKGNGKWITIAGGNGWIGEALSNDYFQSFQEIGLNIVYVNGPMVGCSIGLPTSDSIRAGQEAGLQFLEEAIQAKKILLYGTSLGGGAQAAAIYKHAFRKDIDYMVWSDRSFDTLSNAASSMITRLIKPLFFLLGIELDGIKGARKLKELGIKQIVTQHTEGKIEDDVLPLIGTIEEKGSDDTIPNRASLYVGLRKAGIQDSPRLVCYGNPSINHNGDLPLNITRKIQNQIRSFLHN